MTQRMPPQSSSERENTRPVRPITSERGPSAPQASQRSAYGSVRASRNRRGGLYLPWWSIALMLGTVAVVAIVIIGVVILLGGGIPPAPPPQFVIVTAPPTETPVGASIAAPTATTDPVVTLPGLFPTFVLEGPTLPPVVLTPTPRQITIGATVMVTEDDVRLRPQPGLNNREIELLRQGMLFRVIGGPEMANSMAWWQVEDLSQPSRTGWISGLYLTLP